MERNEDAHPELVWAKFSRYPWWPAFLTGIKTAEGVEVQFFGTFELSFIKDGFVKPFNGVPPLDPKNLRSKRLQVAIESAFSVQEGASTIEEEKLKVAKGGRTSNPARLNRILSRIAEQIQADNGAEPEPNSSKFDSLEAFSHTDNEVSPCQSCQKIETFETLQLRIQALYGKLICFGKGFANDFDGFAAAIRESLTERHMKELLASQVGRLLVQLKSQIQASDVGKELRRRALYDITTLLNSMKKKIVDYFFMNADTAGQLPHELTPSLADTILELATTKPEEKPAHHFSASPKRTSSHRISQKSAHAAEPEQFKEKFKISLEVKNRVLKKFSKFLSQYSDQKLEKSEAEKLSKLIHEQICMQTTTLHEYKRAVVSFVHKRAELCDFFKFKCLDEQSPSRECVWDDLLHLLFR